MESVERPAWTQDDLHAYRHKFTADKNDVVTKIENYYEKPCNQIGLDKKRIKSSIL